MKDIFLIFPIHLFSNIEILKNKKVYLIEEKRFFTDFKYHKLKIAYHRASMKSYFDFLKSHNINVNYIEFHTNLNNLYKEINNSKDNIYTYDLGDDILKNKLKKYIKNINIINSLNFLVNEQLLKDNINEFYNKKKYNHQNFYKWQRIRLNILITKNNKPIGGKWSFDEDNRKKLPKNISIPHINPIKKNKYIEEAINYTLFHFKNNYGSLENFIYPINHHESKIWLNDFLQHRFKNFGTYEDAETTKSVFLFHSVLTPMMNIGLLTDKEVINETLKYESKVPLPSFEGFIRQIIGWRNYIYSIYLLEGKSLKKCNFLKHKNKLNKEIMWTSQTDILPIDNIIKKIVDYGYAHHIERLMYLGNYLLLCMIDPNNVYEIFMEWTIDAYEWVMVPNVYGMSQFADGGLMMTRPYFSSSNYILKMSDYKKSEWCKTFDYLYYNFISKHQKYLESNYATSRQVFFWKKKSENDKKNILKEAEIYLKKKLL
jgi:deoxyribodipyrimidine photolyase-related protein